MAILITGSSGFIGQRLAEALQPAADVVCMSRGKRRSETTHIQGSFDRFEDLRKLDGFKIEAVVHLAAVTGGSSEEDALATNVAGTRRLYRYLLDRGCGKFITASSIAVPGGLSGDFLPLELPIPDEHPCLAADAYGFSKAMVEQLTHYFHRLHSEADFVNLRFGAVVPDDWRLSDEKPIGQMHIPFVQLAHVYVEDIVRALLHVLETPLKPGVRTCNVVGADVSSYGTTLDALREVLGDSCSQYDLSYYGEVGHERKPIYAMERMYREFGFAPVKRFLEK